MFEVSENLGVSSPTDTHRREFPATPGQVRFWLLERMQPGSLSARVMFNRMWVGPLDLDALRAAWFDVVLRHEPLRTTFAETGTGVVQVVHGPQIAPFDVDRAPSDEAEVDGAIRAWLGELRTRPFDLERGPLARLQVLVLGPRCQLLAVDMHHGVFDAFSAAVLVRDLMASYEARLTGRPAELPEITESYGARARRQQHDVLGAGIVAEALARISDTPWTIELPADRRRPLVEDPASVTSQRALARSLTDVLTDFTRRIGVRRSVPYLAATAVLVQRWTGEDVFLIGLPVSGRDDPGAQELVGYFVNTAVVRLDLTGAPSTLELLTRVDAAIDAALSQRSVPIDELVSAARVPLDRGSHPLFQIIFNFTTIPTTVMQSGGIELHRIWEAPGHAIGDLDVDIRRYPDATEEAKLQVTGKAALFDPATVDRFAAQFTHVLRQLADDHDGPITSLTLMAPDEEREVFARGRGPALPAEQRVDVYDRFARVATERPGVLALVGPDDSRWSYRELDAAVGQRAEALRMLGSGPGALVAIQVDQPVEAVISILAAWRTGAGYVPLPIDSEARAALILAETRPVAVVAGAIVTAGELPGRRLERSDIAAVIFTSGSTGAPKGVCVTRANLAASTAARRALYGDDPQTMLLTYPLLFDAALSPLLWTLTTGGTLVVPELERRADPRLLSKLVESHGATALDLLPGVWSALLEHDKPARLSSLKIVVVGAETCPPALLARHFSQLPSCRLFNEYGPTEATVFATVHECRPDDQLRPSVPIGRAIPGYRISVLDRVGRPTPVGVPGELVIAGPGVSAGYLDRPELTSDRFVADADRCADPGADRGGDRGGETEHRGGAPTGSASMVYRTGDRARLLADDTVEFLGRIDRQLKVSGHRIEPGEIEAVLIEHPGVRAAVVGLDPAAQHARLVAHVEGPADLEPDSLSAHARARLPAAMVPSTIVVHDRLPRTASGKVDPGVLTAAIAMSTEAERAERSVESLAATRPVTNTEQRLALLFAEVLGHHVGANDDFFSAGGSSMASLRLFALIERDLGLDLPLATLFRAPTVSSLAALMDELDAGEWRPLVRLSGRGASPATPPEGSGPVIFAHGLGGNITGFANLARRLGLDHVCYAIQSGGLDGRGIPYRSIDEMADRAVAEIVRTVAPGPCVIAGLSFGGLVACEIANRLVATGHQPRVVMLDAAAPGFRSRPRTTRARFSRPLRYLQFRIELRAGRRIPVMRRRHYLFLAHDRLFDRHPLRVYDLPMTLMCTEALSDEHVQRWRSLAWNGLDVRIVPGDHASFLEEPLVAETARTLAEIID